MGKFKLWLAKKLLNYDIEVADAGSSANRDPSASAVKKVGLRLGDITSKDFEDPEFDLSEIQTGYNADTI